MAKVQLWGYRCERCGHEWVPRDKDQDPRVCPKCKSPYWDRPRKEAKAESAELGSPSQQEVMATTEVQDKPKR